MNHASSAVPILQPPPTQVGGQYAAELHTADGDQHLATAKFMRPAGAVDLGAQTKFDPRAQYEGMLKLNIMAASGVPVQVPAGLQLTPIIDILGGGFVNLGQVAYFRYLGEVTKVDDASKLLHYVDPDGQSWRVAYGRPTGAMRTSPVGTLVGGLAA